jgi:hypothetical protein
VSIPAPTEKMPRLLSSCPSALRRLNRKAELLGINTQVGGIQAQNWHEHVYRHGRMVRTSDSQPKGRGIESRRRHGAVSVSRIP